MQAHTSPRGAPLDTAESALFERIFLEHPRSLGESYWEHQRRALGIAISMVTGGVACLIHALVPVLFQSTASKTIRRLYEYLVLTRRIGRVGGD